LRNRLLERIDPTPAAGNRDRVTNSRARLGDWALARRIRSFAKLGHRKAAANFSPKQIGYLGMAWHSFHLSGLGIAPQGMCATFALQVTAVQSEMAQERLTLHWMVTVSHSASAGAPRRPSSRRSSRISCMAALKLSRHSSTVRPCPFAPGISGDHPTNQSPSRSMMAVNSFRME
jgi:hypothetical protein